jgi:hypothetical protein
MLLMHRLPSRFALALISPFLVTILHADESPAAREFVPLVTIRELMERTITPATNTLWNAFEPPATDEQWQALEEAAVTLLVAANVNSLGGTGARDNEWVREPAWREFNRVMIEAGKQSLAAIRERDHDALLAAGDVLYPPCEGCHQQFNPGVRGRE